MERKVAVDTGESVAFQYELAGLGSRFLAVFIDLILQVFVAFSLFLLLAFLTLLPAWQALHIGAHILKVGTGVLLGLSIFGFFILFFGYFIILEWAWKGKTPGKRLIGIRVVRDGGFPLDFTSAVIRNVVRVLEFGLGFYALSAISTLLSAQNKRLGDFAAGTIVVRDARFEGYLPAPAAERVIDDPGVRELTSAQRELIRQYAGRREKLEVRARQALAADIARSVRPRLGANFDYLDDDALLVHLARTAL